MSGAILVVEDEPIVRDVLSRYLTQAGFDPIEAKTGREAQTILSERDVTLVLLDLMLPEVDGLTLCRWIRGRSTVPIIMLTARGDEADRIIGLEIGADDYVAKPFSPREVIARIRAVLRRSDDAPAPSEPIVAGALHIDPAAREVRRGRKPLKLTSREFDLLLFLASHPQRVFTRSQLMKRVWGYEASLDTGTLTVHIRRLREKIEDDPAHPAHLETVWGVGYRFTP